MLTAQRLKVSQGKVKTRTVDEYQRLLRCYVLGDLGGIAVAAITPTRCEAFLAALVQQPSRQGDREPLTPGTVKHVWDVLRRVLRYAVHHGAIPTNPTDRVDFSASRATGDHAQFEHHPLSAEQVGRLASAVRGEVAGLPAYPAYALMVEFMAYTGLRSAEVIGLEVGDLGLRTGPTLFGERASNQGPQGRRVGYRHTQVQEVTADRAVAGVARRTNGRLPRRAPARP